MSTWIIVDDNVEKPRQREETIRLVSIQSITKVEIKTTYMPGQNPAHAKLDAKTAEPKAESFKISVWSGGEKLDIATFIDDGLAKEQISNLLSSLNVSSENIADYRSKKEGNDNSRTLAVVPYLVVINRNLES